MGYANIMNVQTTGASWVTSQHLGGITGVAASQKIAEMDSVEMGKYKSIIRNAASKFGVDPALIAGIISRESNAGVTLQNGWGDNGKAWGLMQVDVTPDGGRHKKRGAWNSEEHLCHGTEILVGFIDRIRQKFPNWSPEMQLKGGIAAYNQGDGSVTSTNVDAQTTSGDYANDVVARAQWYKRNF